MTTVDPERLGLSDAWIEGDPSARWRSAAALGPGNGADETGASLLEVDPGCRLARHTDSAEETIVVLKGKAEVEIDENRELVERNGIALVPTRQPHSVANAGDEPLRFLAFYSSAEVVTTYEAPVEPDGGRERNPVA